MPTQPLHLFQPRILFYAVNGLGLGHVTRLLAIARAVRAACEGAQILFITTTEADSVIYREGFASVKIPSRGVIQASRLRPSAYNKLAHTVVMNTVAAFNPAILVADTFPAGASQELLPTLSWEMRRVFVYRAQQVERARDPFFQATLGHYDLGIVPHEEGSEEMPAPANIRLVWTGDILIRERGETLPRGAARRRLNLPREGKLLYATVGGGGDDEMARSEGMIFDAARAAGWTVVAPEAPLLKKAAPEPLRPNNGGPEESFVDNIAQPDYRVAYYPMAECLNAFDAAVSAAGYNSVNELLHFGIPTLLIPRERGLDDQFARTHKAETAGAALSAGLEAVEIEEKLKQLNEDVMLRERMAQKAMACVPQSGAKIAAAEILALL